MECTWYLLVKCILRSNITKGRFYFITVLRKIQPLLAEKDKNGCDTVLSVL